MLLGLKLIQPLWISVWLFLRKMGINLPQDPAITRGYFILPRDTWLKPAHCCSIHNS